MSAPELNQKIDELTKDYLKLLLKARNYEEKLSIFKTYYKTLLTLQQIKFNEIDKR
jgi:hypothetical protein